LLLAKTRKAIEPRLARAFLFRKTAIRFYRGGQAKSIDGEQQTQVRSTPCPSLFTARRWRLPNKGVVATIAIRGVAMTKQILTAILHKEEDIYVAECPEIGTVSQGYTVEEAVANLKEATELYLEEFPLPEITRPLLTTFEVAAYA
jgi:predicted RNase H-like HicB family nuclease